MSKMSFCCVVELSTTNNNTFYLKARLWALKEHCTIHIKKTVRNRQKSLKLAC